LAPVFDAPGNKSKPPFSKTDKIKYLTPTQHLTPIGSFVARAAVPAEARAAAATAFVDTVGVMLAGALEPASRIVQRTIAADGAGPCTIAGAGAGASATAAALANGTAAHALDFDDMCFVSLAHPSAPLVPAILAAAERGALSGRAALDAYVVGFEVETRLGRVMNPRHYRRGWHCTSTLGAIGCAAAVARLLGLDAATAGRAVAIAASSAGGLKENFGTMVKPLHAGLAAQAGLRAADLAAAGFTASDAALDGPQGFLHAMDSEHDSIEGVAGDLGSRWEILASGITIKLYPSCAGTHPTLDTVLDLRRELGITDADVDRVDVGVDAITPTVLLYDRPVSGLQGKFSLHYCVAAALVHGRVSLDTFDDDAVHDPAVSALLPRVTMRVDDTLDQSAPPLTQAHVTIALRDGRTHTRLATGARGYPTLAASDREVDDKFLTCATRVLSADRAKAALNLLRALESLDDVRVLTAALRP
jgi:2-methylcitrate dehydratase PrpD